MDTNRVPILISLSRVFIFSYKCFHLSMSVKDFGTDFLDIRGTISIVSFSKSGSRDTGFKCSIATRSILPGEFTYLSYEP